MQQNPDAATQARPTCKVVTRPNKSGAVIYPRGCKVRNRVTDAGNYHYRPGHQTVPVHKVARATGRLKPSKETVRAQGREFTIDIRYRHGPAVPILWDTGATVTSIREDTAKTMGILRDDGMPRHPLFFGGVMHMENAHGGVIAEQYIDNVPLTVVRQGHEEEVRGTITIDKEERGSNLFGVNLIRQIKRLKVKFRQ